MNPRTDYSELTNIKTAKQKAEEHKRELIEADIKLIDETVKSVDEERVREVHRMIDGKYQACIKAWGMGMQAYHLDHGFMYGKLDMESLKDNLKLMKPKLVTYVEGWNDLSNFATQDSTDVSVVVNNNNNINIDVTFEQAKQKIEEMPGLTQRDTEEIQEKIDELEKISNENTTKKKKWEKVKPILVFALDKGADVAIMIMGLILQMKLGM